MQSASVAKTSRTLPILAAAALLLSLGGCATTPHWGVSGGDREHGVVRVSYEYPEFHQPALSDEQAMKTAVRPLQWLGLRQRGTHRRASSVSAAT